MLLKITHRTRLDYTCEVEGTIFEARMAPGRMTIKPLIGINLHQPQTPL
jgi:hypothetical protein